MHETPTANSLLIADRVYRDVETKKWIISGVFNTVAFQEFPASADALECFFQVTNVSRPVDLHFRIERADTSDVIVDFGGPIASPSPLNVVEQKVVVRGIQFPAPGKYWVQLVSHEEIITQAPLNVKQIREKPSESGPEDEDEDDVV